MVVLPRADHPDRCPVTTLQHWRDLAGIDDGPLLRPVAKSNAATPRPLNLESVNTLVQEAMARAELDPAHSLRTAASSVQAWWMRT